MNRMMLGAVAILVAGDVSAMDMSAISATGSSQNAVNAFSVVNQETRSSVVSHEKKKGELVMGILKASGYVVLAGGSLVLFSAPYIPGFYAMGVYEGLKFMGVGAFKSGVVAAVSTSLAVNLSSICHKAGKKGVIKSINYFKGKKH